MLSCSLIQGNKDPELTFIEELKTGFVPVITRSLEMSDCSETGSPQGLFAAATKGAIVPEVKLQFVTTSYFILRIFVLFIAPPLPSSPVEDKMEL